MGDNNPFFNGGGADESNPFDEMQEFDQKFYSLSLTDGKASGGQIKQIMMQSQLSNNVLGKIWQLADIDKDGLMSDQEFALCCFLIDYAKDGKTIPNTLPDNYIPPKFRAMIMKK